MIRKNSKKYLVRPEFLVSISNQLALGKLSVNLTLRQLQLLLYIIIHEQREFKYDLLKCDFDKTIIKNTYSTANLRNDIEVLRNLKIDLDVGIDCSVEVFKNIEYIRGKFQFEFSESFLRHIKDLKDNYVVLNYAAIGKFESVYSCKLYVFMRAKFGYWNLTFSKMKLIELLGIEQHSSYLINDNMFEARVLDKVKNEINFYSEITITWDGIYSYREPSSYKLSWTRGDYVKTLSTKQENELMYYIKIIQRDLSNLKKNRVDEKEIVAIKPKILGIEEEINKGLKASEFRSKKKELMSLVKYCERYAD